MRAKRARESEPLALMVNKPPAVFIFIREIDDLQRENRSTISKEKVEGLWTGYEGACYYFSELYKSSQVTMLTSWKVYFNSLFKFREGGWDGWVGWHWVLHSTLHIQKFMSLSLHLELADFFWSTKLAYENKRFSLPPLNVWFRVAEHKSRCTVPEQPTGCSFKRGP